MPEIVYTLLGEGPSDRRLLHPINWAMSVATQEPFRAQWADKRALRVTSGGLAARIAAAVHEFPCDILFVHRDCDNADLGHRRAEIDTALETIGGYRHVKVIPVRMQEAWFLVNEAAIRAAAGRPSGKQDLNLPAIHSVEGIADPKARLHEAIRIASGRKGRRWRRTSVGEIASRVAELMTDYSVLRGLPAFAQFEADLSACLAVA